MIFEGSSLRYSANNLRRVDASYLLFHSSKADLRKGARSLCPLRYGYMHAMNSSDVEFSERSMPVLSLMISFIPGTSHPITGIPYDRASQSAMGSPPSHRLISMAQSIGSVRYMLCISSLRSIPFRSMVRLYGSCAGIDAAACSCTDRHRHVSTGILIQVCCGLSRSVKSDSV